MQLTVKVAKTNLKVAHQGVPGAYSEVAARKSCPEYEPLPCTQFEIAFQVCEVPHGWFDVGMYTQRSAVADSKPVAARCKPAQS